MNKKIDYIVFPFIAVLSFLSASSVYRWLQSIQANYTLKTIVPLIFFFATLAGLWLLLSFFKLYLFRRKGVQGYRLRGKITSYFLLSTVSFIIIFGGLTFYLIFLMENTFIDREREVTDNILESYKSMIAINRNVYEKEIFEDAHRNPSRFPVVFYYSGNRVTFIKNESSEISEKILESANNIKSFFDNQEEKVFHAGDTFQISVVRRNNLYFAEYTKKELTTAFQSLKKNADTLQRLRVLKKYIFPVSVISVFILSIPILIGVFFVSLSVAKSITIPIEEIARGIKIIADGNLDYKVAIKTHDEIGDLAYHYNSMATKLKQAYQQIKRMERIEAWQEMARRLAHEVKNPLTPIKLSAERLLYAYEFKTEEFAEILKKTTSTIIDETKRLENLVNEFSKFARLPSMKIERKNIKNTLQELLDFFRTAYPDYKIEDQILFDELYVDYDENQIKQVIINLMKNALEAYLDGDKWVLISAEKRENNLVISILDKGPGIPVDIQDKIFEPYFSTKKQGVGIGLAIAERIISEHNGNIWFETGEGGSIFFVELPIRNTQNLYTVER